MRALAIALLTCVLALAADSPFIGAWTMNKSKSKLDPKAPKIDSMSTQFIQDGPALKVIITTNGTAAPAAELDGKEHPVVAVNAGPIGPTHFVSNVNGPHISTILKRDGKVVGMRKTTMSADGKSYTAVSDGVLPNGTKTHSIAVFEKQ